MKTLEGFTHGINFGGWFSQCDNTEKRYEYFIRRADFRRVARWGLDHVRVPVDYNLLLNADNSFREAGFERLDKCVDWAAENGLNMIIDLHKTPGFSFDEGENEEGFFESEYYQQLFYAIWEKIAGRYGSRKHIAFELLNEVSDKEYCDKWNEISQEATRRIRKIAPDNYILVGGYWHNSPEAVADIRLADCSNLVYNFHCYSPLIFTHQGAYWINKMDTSFRMPFDSKNSDYTKFTETYIGLDFVDTFGADDKEIDEDYFRNLFAEALEAARSADVPIYCGEYGVIDLAEPEDAVKWYKCISKVFDEYGIGRAAWSYKEMDFGLVDAAYDDVRDEIIALL